MTHEGLHVVKLILSCKGIVVDFGAQASSLDCLLHNLECYEGNLLVVRIHDSLHHTIDHLLQAPSVTITVLFIDQGGVDGLSQRLINEINVLL